MRAAPRSAALVLASAALLALIYVVFAWGNGLDRLSAREPAVAAAVPAPFRNHAERVEAMLDLAGRRSAHAQQPAAAAIAASPADASRLGLWATSRLAAGDAQGAREGFVLAARGGWRDPLTQAYWLEAALAAGEWDRAAERLDALLRADPEMPGRDGLVGRFEGKAEGRAALANRLAQDPIWSGYVLRGTRGLDDEALERRAATVIAAAGSGRKLGCSKVGPLVQQLVDAGRGDAARGVWTAHCESGGTGNGLADGNFARLARDGESGPFGWRRVRDGDVSLRPLRGEGGLLLSNDAPSARRVLAQALLLEPGDYEVKLDGDGARVAASLDCGSASRPAFGKEGRSTVRVECAAPTLTIWVAARSSEARLRRIALTPAR